jgi:predicted HTH domain antitoxin
VTLEVDLPEQVLEWISREELESFCRTEIVVRLYRQDRVSVDEAAGLLGVARVEFLALLLERRIGFRTGLTPEDVRQLQRVSAQWAR